MIHRDPGMMSRACLIAVMYVVSRTSALFFATPPCRCALAAAASVEAPRKSRAEGALMELLAKRRELEVKGDKA